MRRAVLLLGLFLAGCGSQTTSNGTTSTTGSDTRGTAGGPAPSGNTTGSTTGGTPGGLTDPNCTSATANGNAIVALHDYAFEPACVCRSRWHHRAIHQPGQHAA